MLRCSLRLSSVSSDGLDDRSESQGEPTHGLSESESNSPNMMLV